MIVIDGTTYGRMADSIIPANLPGGMDAYLGYVDGAWADWLAIVAAHPGVPVFGLDVYGQPVGSGVDSEPGDATIAQAVLAINGDLARGVQRPIAYCPASWANPFVAALADSRIARNQYRLLTAHIDGPTMPGGQPGQHICAQNVCGYAGAGADGTQWIFHPGWDESLVYGLFLNATPHPGPPPPPSKPTPRVQDPQVDQMHKQLITLPTNGQGNGWTPVPVGVPFDKLIGVEINPNLTAGGTPGVAHAAIDGTGVYVEVVGAHPNSDVGVWLSIAN